jgi:hypothetical protein
VQSSVSDERGHRMTELPIACSLDAGDLETRQAELAAIGRRSLLSVGRADGAPVVLAFKSDAETKAELERIVAAEAACCAFLELTITTGDSLQLTIDGPEDAGPIVDELVSAIASGAS